jgi:hypothetical protein
MQKPSNKKYSATFTASALLFEEFVRIRDMLLSGDFEQLIGVEVEENRLLGIKTRVARQRMVYEMKRRFANTLPGFWNFFFERTEPEQRLMLFFLCLKTYHLMLDFHLEVTLKRWKAMSGTLEIFDLQMRLDEIASMDEDVGAWSELTKQKTITVYLRTLKESGLFKNEHLIKPTQTEPDLWEYFIKNGESWFPGACFVHPVPR